MSDAIDDAIYQAMALGKSGDIEGAWEVMRPYRSNADDDPRVAWAWLILAKNSGDAAAHREVITELGSRWCHDPHIANLAATALSGLVEGRGVDDPIEADDPSRDAMRIAGAAIEALRHRGDARIQDAKVGGALFWTLGNACRLAGRDYDEDAAAALSAAQELHPNDPWLKFDRGLLHKFAGEHREALACFAAVLEAAPDDEAALNNLAVSATIAGMGDLAASAWTALQFEDVSLDEDGLPRVPGGGPVKVRLPVDDGPVAFEHVWVETHSPCHGRVLNPPAYSNAVAYSDLVVFDRHQIGWAELEGIRQPRFPLLAKIRTGSAITALFIAATGEMVDAVEGLPEGVSLYRFDTNIGAVCDECVRDGTAHEGHALPERVGAVHGAVLLESEDLAAAVSAALVEAGIVSPDLFRVLGDGAAADAAAEAWDAIAKGLKPR